MKVEEEEKRHVFSHPPRSTVAAGLSQDLDGATSRSDLLPMAKSEVELERELAPR